MLVGIDSCVYNLPRILFIFSVPLRDPHNFYFKPRYQKPRSSSSNHRRINTGISLLSYFFFCNFFLYFNYRKNEDHRSVHPIRQIWRRIIISTHHNWIFFHYFLSVCLSVSTSRRDVETIYFSLFSLVTCIFFVLVFSAEILSSITIKFYHNRFLSS